MSVEYRESTVTKMDLDESKIAYKQFFADGSPLRYSVYVLRNNPFKIATACLGLLCVLLLAGVIGQRVHYQNVKEDNKMKMRSLVKEKDDMRENLHIAQTQKNNIDAIRNELQGRFDRLYRRVNQLQMNNYELSQEKDQLQQNQKQSEDSNTALNKQVEQLKSKNTQLQSDKDSLTAAQRNLQTLYESVVSSKTELQANYDSVQRDRNNLQNKFNNVTRSREQLQMSYNDQIQKMEHLQDKYNFSASENDKLASNHQNLTVQLQSLQETYNILKKAENDLQASYASVVQEKNELEGRLKNVTLERDLLKLRSDNLTAERDQLLEEAQKLNATIQEKKCPAGWHKFQYSCYYTTAAKKTWALSREFCQSKGADLAIIKSEEEMTFINGLYSSDKEAWIGLSDGGVEGQWEWVDGTPLTLTFWAKGQPNSHQGRNQDCVEFWHRSSSRGDWNDEGCSVEQSWICEM